jgi:hypothetical protein
MEGLQPHVNWKLIQLNYLQPLRKVEKNFLSLELKLNKLFNDILSILRLQNYSIIIYNVKPLLTNPPPQ